MPSAPPARVISISEFSTVAGRSTLGVVAVAARFEADAIDGAIHFRHADDLLDLLGQRGVLAEVDRLAAEALGLREPLGDHVADDDHGRAQQMAGRGAGQADRARAGDVDDRCPGRRRP